MRDLFPAGLVADEVAPARKGHELRNAPLILIGPVVLLGQMRRDDLVLLTADQQQGRVRRVEIDPAILTHAVAQDIAAVMRRRRFERARCLLFAHLRIRRLEEADVHGPQNRVNLT